VPRAHHLLVLISLTAIILLVVTLDRVPTPTSDSDFYGSIARSEQMYGVGIPSVLRYSPTAVDHIPFYGPVFFAAAARAFTWFGPSLGSLRLVSLIGAFLIVAAAALLAHAIAATKWRWLWAATLVLLAPELRQYATLGTMATLAIGFEMLALAVFVRGLRATDRSLWYGAGAGALLSLAALTTPRTYLFIAAFFAAGMCGPCLSRDARQRAWRMIAVAFSTLTVGVGAWATVSHGGAAAWARYIGFILTHEDSDVAVLASSSREWLFSAANAAVPLIAAACALAAATLLSRRVEAGSLDREQAGIAAFALLAGWMAFVAGLVTLNLTFTQTTYIALPLFVVVLAMPYESFRVPPRVLAAAAVAVLSLETGLAGIWYARVAATWDARDPEGLSSFFDRYVPDGAAVIGPPAPYFFAVERSGARYRSISPESWADWARWVPVVEPQAVADARLAPIAITRGRYLIWRADDDVPAAYACAATHRIAMYEPAPHHLAVLGWLGGRTRDTGYPKSVLYSLPPGCPIGYDPTHS
jgi:hypothetical protein